MNTEYYSARIRRRIKWLVPDKHRGSFLDIENKEGVYVLYAFLGNPNERRPVVYVGKTKNLNKRLTGHEIDRFLNKNNIYASCKIKYCSDPARLESELIKKIKPIFNLQHNKEFVKKVYFDYVLSRLQRKKDENIS